MNNAESLIKNFKTIGSEKKNKLNVLQYIRSWSPKKMKYNQNPIIKKFTINVKKFEKLKEKAENKKLN